MQSTSKENKNYTYPFPHPEWDTSRKNITHMTTVKLAQQFSYTQLPPQWRKAL